MTNIDISPRKFWEGRQPEMELPIIFFSALFAVYKSWHQYRIVTTAIRISSVVGYCRCIVRQVPGSTPGPILLNKAKYRQNRVTLNSIRKKGRDHITTHNNFPDYTICIDYTDPALMTLHYLYLRVLNSDD